jgi:hypothetical protein
MANPVEQRPDGLPSGGAPGPRPADASTPAPRLPTRVPFAGPHPGSADPGRPRSETPPPGQVAARRSTLTDRYRRSALVSRRPGAAVDVPGPVFATPPDNPAKTPRNRIFRVRILSGATVAALLVAGSLWWSHDRTTGETASAAPPGAGTATMPVAAPVTGDASAGTGTAGDRPTAGSVDSAVPPPAPPPRPTSKAAPRVKASANTSGRDLALHARATASSVERADWAASNAVDGNPGTRWSSGFTDPQWLRVDLGARWQISEIRLSWENAHATAYRVEISTDGTTWKTVYRTSNGQGGDVVVEVAKLPARFVRMYGTKRSTDFGYSLFELDVS